MDMASFSRQLYSDQDRQKRFALLGVAIGLNRSTREERTVITFRFDESKH